MALLSALATEAGVVTPVAVILHLRWPIWGAALPFLLWLSVAFLPALPRSHSSREPDDNEKARLSAPWQQLTQRAALHPNDYRLVLTDQESLNACAATKHEVLATTHSAQTLPPAQLEAILAHELGHHHISTSLSTRLTWPSRLLWWLLRTLWTPVRPMWKRAVEWHRPIGFLLAFLLAAIATAVTVAAIPSAITHAMHRLTRPLANHTEFQADAFAVRLGLGPDLLAAIEHQLETTAPDAPLPMLLVRRAEHLRRHLT